MTDMISENDKISRKNNEESDVSSGSSPEAAGVARGAVKTASTLSRRAVIGRLPKPAVIPKARPMTRTGLFPKKVPMKQVVKVSDRISTGFDAYDAASSSNAGDDKLGKKSEWKQFGKRVVSFSGSLLKNTIIGAGLFEAFEKTIVYLDRKNCEAKHEGTVTMPQAQNQGDEAKLGDAFSRTSVQQHFGAGVVGGSVHSVLLMTFQSGAFIRENGFNGLRMMTMSSFSSISAWSVVHTFHHGVAHGLLFSSYEGTKRLLFSDTLLHRLHISPFQNENSSLNDVIKIGFAGGVAGQIQHLASHYTEAWLLGAGEDRRRTYLKDIKKNKIFVPGPSFKSILLAFPPSAIGFIAFEFGKLLMV